MKGTYYHNMDAKGRLFIPVKLKEELGDSFVATKGFNGCISLYSQDQWKKLEKSIEKRSNAQKIKLRAFFLGNAMDCEFDSQGRMQIPILLRKHANLEKEVAVIGVGKEAQIWDMNKWEIYNSSIDEEEVLEIWGEIADDDEDE